MSLGFWFWLIYVIWVVYNSWWIWWPLGRLHLGGYFWLVVLIGILGWHAFGNPFSVLVR